jgi:predicted amidohydrolase
MGCLDHLLEQDLYLHCWEMLERILKDDSCYDILLDIGMPTQHRNVRYNCRVTCLNGKILLIRPKMWLANDGNYREVPDLLKGSSISTPCSSSFIPNRRPVTPTFAEKSSRDL